MLQSNTTFDVLAVSFASNKVTRVVASNVSFEEASKVAAFTQGSEGEWFAKTAAGKMFVGDTFAEESKGGGRF